jgi:serine/threonine-protein kinase
LQPNQVLVSADLDTVKVCNMGFEQTFRNITRGKQPWWEDPGMNPAYMPPELFPKRPGNINEKAVDVYLIGLIAYLLVTGEPPFEGPGLDDFKFQHTKIYPAPPRLVHPDVPDWLEPLILGCLDKDPNKRWASVIDIQETFSREIGPST